ncbi:MAG: HAMP domain-containing protein [Acidimicrobiia bacterium]
MRRRLAVLSVAVVLLVVLAFVIPLMLLVRNQAQNRALSDAERDAQALAAALAVAGGGAEGSRVTAELAQAVIDALPREVSIIFPDGTYRGAPFIDSPNIDQAREGLAFTAFTRGGAEVLVPVFTADAPPRVGLEGGDTVVVRAFVTDADLRRGVVAAWLMLGGLAVFLVVVGGIAADRLGGSIVQPVTALSAAARRFGDGDLATRVDPKGPQEIAEVGEAFNFLADRLDALLAAERESVADLSHRLRTPLTALRLQAETLEDPAESAALLADIEQLERAVDRMIGEARRPSVADGDRPVSDLGAVVRHRATFWKVLADEQGRPAAVHTSGGALPVAMHPDELGALVDTLIENVFAHTPPGAGYIIRAMPGDDGHSLLVIEDDGPGFRSDEALERGASGGGSTGLGLDIARTAARRTGGDLDVVQATGRGARIEVRLGESDRTGSV